jgi:hypothetical protein
MVDLAAVALLQDLLAIHLGIAPLEHIRCGAPILGGRRLNLGEPAQRGLAFRLSKPIPQPDQGRPRPGGRGALAPAGEGIGADAGLECRELVGRTHEHGLAELVDVRFDGDGGTGHRSCSRVPVSPSPHARVGRKTRKTPADRWRLHGVAAGADILSPPPPR